MEEHRDKQRHNQRPPINVASGTMRDGLRLAGFQLVEAAVDLIHVPGVGGLGVEPTGCRSDLLALVFFPRVLAAAWRTAGARPDADCGSRSVSLESAVRLQPLTGFPLVSPIS